MFLPFEDTGTENILRYQPIPPRKAPPPVPVGLVESNGNSMLQSCGRSRFRQEASSLPGSLNECTLSSLNFQLSLNVILLFDWAKEPRKKNEKQIDEANLIHFLIK